MTPRPGAPGAPGGPRGRTRVQGPEASYTHRNNVSTRLRLHTELGGSTAFPSAEAVTNCLSVRRMTAIQIPNRADRQRRLLRSGACAGRCTCSSFQCDTSNDRNCVLATLELLAEHVREHEHCSDTARKVPTI
jgi:hypothetical protein